MPTFEAIADSIFDRQSLKTLNRLEGKKFAKKDIEDIKLNIDEEQRDIEDAWLDPSVNFAIITGINTAEIFGFANAAIKESEARAFLLESIRRFSKETTETTNIAIAQTLLDGMDEGESIVSLRKRIMDVFDDAKKSRAEMIARTELTRTSTWSNEEIYRQVGITKKEWLTNPGACEFCIPMNGKIVEITSTFIPKNRLVDGQDGGEMKTTYESIMRPPLHPNCRCDILPVV